MLGPPIFRLVRFSKSSMCDGGTWDEARRSIKTREAGARDNTELIQVDSPLRSNTSRTCHQVPSGCHPLCALPIGQGWGAVPSALPTPIRGLAQPRHPARSGLWAAHAHAATSPDGMKPLTFSQYLTSSKSPNYSATRRLDRSIHPRLRCP
jgi:hypothetical protein